MSIFLVYSLPQVNSDENEQGLCIEVGEYDVDKFPVTL